MVSPDLGFPAGKNKTILIDLQQVAAAGVAHARRLRLRTNLEVYWDWLAVADGVERRAAQHDAAPTRARGAALSRVLADRPLEPPAARDSGVRQDCQRHAALARSGRLLHAVRRRPRASRRGRRSVRDHERGRRAAAVVPRARASRQRAGRAISCWSATAGKRTATTTRPSRRPSSRCRGTIGPTTSRIRDAELEDDPVYRRHPRDWETYHTRFVTPGGFLSGLR